MDVAGDWATKRGIDLALSQGFNIKVVLMPEDLDPADIISKNQKDWEKLVGEARSILEFYFESVLSRSDPKTPEGRKKISKTILPIIKRIPNKIEQSFWIQNLAKILEVKETAIAEELRKTKTSQIQEKEGFSPVAPKKSRQELLEERLVTLALKSPDFLNFLQKEDFALFSSPISQVFTHLKDKPSSQEKGYWVSKEDLENLSPEFTNLLNYLLLKAEIETEENNIQEEFKTCLKEIKYLAIKNKLDKISKDIKTAETENDLSKAQKLLEEFNHHSKKLGDLEDKT